MLFGLSHREKRVKKINLLHLKLPEPSTDSGRPYLCPYIRI